jgi:hypothetical protein
VTPFSPKGVGPFIDQGTQTVFEKFLAALEDLCHYESLHVVGYSGILATFPFPDEPEALQRLNIEPPTPLDFYQKRLELRSKALDLWMDLGEFISVRYSKYADF